MTQISDLPESLQRFELAPCPIVGLEGDCWLWTGARSSSGHGNVQYKGRFFGIHRLVYTLLRGEIPEGLQIDHLCRVPPCCNPLHLEPVTPRENTLRGKHATKTHCKRNHPLSGANLITYFAGPNKYPRRACRACSRMTPAEKRAAGVAS